MLPLRTLLFAPGNRPRMLAKVGKCGADAVVLDLEDAVPHGEKEGARPRVREAAERIWEEDRCPVYVRINPLGASSPFSVACGAEDLEGIVAPGLFGVVLPKAEGPEEVKVADRLLSDLERERGLPLGGVELAAIVETARGVREVERTAAAGLERRTLRLSFGAGDFTNDLGVAWTRVEWELFYARSRIAVAARAAGLEAPLDSVFFDLEDEEGLLASACVAKGLGFQGKYCIHPKQVKPVNRVFTPTLEEVAAARRVAEAFREAEARGEASVVVDGRMVDYPVVDRAKKTLEVAEAIARREGGGGRQ
ncbi:MAG: HpcH/HpaI aldolase/citrate lyase family protein [Nitrospinota bacterium]